MTQHCSMAPTCFVFIKNAAPDQTSKILQSWHAPDLEVYQRRLQQLQPSELCIGCHHLQCPLLVSQLELQVCIAHTRPNDLQALAESRTSRLQERVAAAQPHCNDGWLRYPA